MMRFGVTVEFDAHKLTDWLVERVMGRESTGSGTDLVKKVRDLQFEFGTRPARKRAVGNLLCSGLPFKKVTTYRLTDDGAEEQCKTMSLALRQRRLRSR